MTSLRLFARLSNWAGFGAGGFQRKWPVAWSRLRSLLMAGSGATVVVLLVRVTGLLQPMELRSLDWMQRLRPVEPVDSRVVLVGITDADLNWLDTPFLNDATLAAVLQAIQQQSPRVIGLDFYRNLPVEPGRSQLDAVLQDSPNLIGIEKVILEEGQSRQDGALPGHPILAERGQVAASDVLVDQDGQVRRGAVFPATTGARVLEGLGTRVALDYLAGEALEPDLEEELLTIAGITIAPLERYSGGYMRLDSGGYQILFNPRRTAKPVELISVRDLLTGNVASDRMTDRIVIVGSAALSAADVFYTSHSNSYFRDSGVTYGMELHAELSSQIVSQVLEGRPALYSLSEGSEMLIIALAAFGGAVFQLWLGERKRNLGLVVAFVGIPLASYGSFAGLGLWLPLIPCLGALGCASLMVTLNRSSQFKTLAERDALTRLANRRRFDEALQRSWMEGLRSSQALSLILCDVDYFKLYNDNYGHSLGDDCLMRVAQVIQQSTVLGSGLAARYGGEEFVVLMPKATAQEALAQANQIRERLVALQLPHEASKITDYVTLSLGVATLTPTMNLPMGALVEQADVALYAAKQSGRNQAKLYDPAMEDSSEELPQAV